MFNEPLTHRPAWKALEHHHKDMAGIPMRDLFAQDPARFEKFHISLNGLLLDYSKHNITEETIQKLCALARACDVEGTRGRLLSGAPINTSENRPALHMALRGSTAPDLVIEGENVTEFTNNTLAQIKRVSDNIRANKTITDVVNIGIGGSDLSAKMVCRALKATADGPRVHFISNVDGAALSDLFQTLSPRNTVFIIASKTFSTLETLTNAAAAKDWLLKTLSPEDLGDHLIAITAHVSRARDFGVPEGRILPLRDWIGGRYSLWGAIGLPVAIANGFEAFRALLNGANAMDEHFIHAPLKRNMPVLMALIGIWYRNFWEYNALALLPYPQALEKLPAYLQQMDMESNGKSVDKNGQPLTYATGPLVFGETGTNAQHAFMQHFHQSRDIIPTDFILVAKADHALPHHHDILINNALAQSKALMEGAENKTQPHRHFTGNRPSTTLILDELTPYHLGMLMALYEHKIFVQGIIWNINSFDQWGVELGKTIASTLMKNGHPADHDSSTAGLKRYLTGAP